MFGSIVCHWLYVYSKVSFHGFKSYWIDFFSFLKKRKCWDIFGHSPKGQKKSKWFFQAEVSSKKPTIEFYFTAMKPHVDMFSFIFWRKLKTPKRHFEINWPLVVENRVNWHHWTIKTVQSKEFWIAKSPSKWVK